MSACQLPRPSYQVISWPPFFRAVTFRFIADIDPACSRMNLSKYCLLLYFSLLPPPFLSSWNKTKHTYMKQLNSHSCQLLLSKSSAWPPWLIMLSLTALWENAALISPAPRADLPQASDWWPPNTRSRTGEWERTFSLPLYSLPFPHTLVCDPKFQQREEILLFTPVKAPIRHTPTSCWAGCSSAQIRQNWCLCALSFKHYL